MARGPVCVLQQVDSAARFCHAACAPNDQVAGLGELTSNEVIHVWALYGAGDMARNGESI